MVSKISKMLLLLSISRIDRWDYRYSGSLFYTFMMLKRSLKLRIAWNLQFNLFMVIAISTAHSHDLLSVEKVFRMNWIKAKILRKAGNSRACPAKCGRGSAMALQLAEQIVRRQFERYYYCRRRWRRSALTETTIRKMWSSQWINELCSKFLGSVVCLGVLVDLFKIRCKVKFSHDGEQLFLFRPNS